jgi:cytochrome c oxidase subunit 2
MRVTPEIPEFMRTLLTGLLLVVFGGCTPSKNQYSPKKAAGPPVGNAEQGKPLYAVCSACHGAQGQGNAALQAPSLANLDGWYLYRQMMNYKKGIRGNASDTLGEQMKAVTAGIGDSIQIAHVAAFIETLSPVHFANTSGGDIKKGERIYQTICGSCHGAGAKGNELMNAPRLNGLEEWYLKRQIKNFQDSVRGSHPDDKLGAQMMAMAALLKSDEALDDVVAYIQSTSSSTE